MRRRICSLVGALSLLAGLAVIATPAPAGAASVAVDLQMVEGGGTLQLRGAEPYSLTTPTSVVGTIDDETGVISGVTFDTPDVHIERDVSSTLPGATAVIDASFSQVAPGTGLLTAADALSVDLDLRVDLDIKVIAAGGEQLDLAGDCTSSPIEMTLSGDVNRATDPDTVELVAGDFTVPPVVGESRVCEPIIAEQVNKELAGSGHSLTVLLRGDLPVIEDGDCDTTTNLVVDPAAEAPLGASVTFTATTAAVTPDDAECVEYAANGPALSGTVDFFRGDTLIGSDDLDGSGVATFATSGMPAGAQELRAEFRGNAPYRSSASAPIAYRVTTKPTITTTLPDFLPIGEPTEFEYTVSNSQFGAALDDVRVDISLRSFVSLPTLERWDGAAWQPVPITGSEPNRFGSLPVFDLASGAERTEKLRISPVTTAGDLTVILELKPDSAPPAAAPSSGISPTALARGEKFASYFTDERVPSEITTTYFPDNIWPHTARQGQTIMVEAITINPSLSSHTADGFIEYFLDGRPVSVALTSDPRPSQLLTRVPLTIAGQANQALIVLPSDIEPGTRYVTVRYSGDQRYLPSQATWPVTVLPARGPSYLCFAEGLPPTYFATNVEAQANLPTAANAGALDLGNLDISVFADRGYITVFNFAGMLNDEGPTAVGEVGLTDIRFTFSGGGTGTATGITQVRAGDPGVLYPGPPASESEVDRIISFDGESGSLNIAGAVGEVVPVTLETIEFDLVADILAIPYNVVCSPVDEPLYMGEVRVSGVNLTVEPAGSVRAGQDVTLTADVGDPAGAGVAEFMDGTDTLGVATVTNGKATMTTDELEPGDHTLKVRYYPQPAGPVQVSPEESLTVLPAVDCAEFAEPGNGAVVRLVYMELLNRCPDQAGYDFWKGQLDDGVSPGRFAETIASTDEAIDQIVIDAYQTTLERNPSADDLDFWRDFLKRRGRYDVLLAALSGSPEFFQKAGSTRAGLVARVYDRLLNREATEADIDYWVGVLLSGKPRSTVMGTLARLKEPMGVIVDDSFREILDTAPSATERSDAVTALQRNGNRTLLYIQLISDPRFRVRAQDFPNFDD